MVKRYDVELIGEDATEVISMPPNPNGHWVEFPDYNDLQQQLAVLQALNQKLLKQIGEGELFVASDTEDYSVIEDIEKAVGYPSSPNPEDSDDISD